MHIIAYLRVYIYIHIITYIYLYRSHEKADDEPPLKYFRPSKAPHDLETCRASALGVSVNTFRLLLFMGFPVICFNMLRLINITVGPVDRNLDCVEYFSGVANIARVFRHNGRGAQTFDYITERLHENLCTPSGWMTAFAYAMQLKPRGLASWATVCSSWIFLCKSCTGRSRAEPWGAPPGPGITASTHDGNAMAARMICVLMLLQARQCTWLLEQPESSVMEYIPEFSYLKMCITKVKTVMGAFNHDSRKGTTLLSCHGWHKVLEKELPPNFSPKKAMTTRFIDGNGIPRCTGIASDLKESQAYTPEYAQAVYDAWLQHKHVEFRAEDYGDAHAPYVEAAIPHGRFDEVENAFGISTTKLFWEAQP